MSKRISILILTMGLMLQNGINAFNLNELADQTVIDKLKLVKAVDEAQIQKIKENLKSSEASRTRLRYAAIAASALGAGYMTWRWLNSKPDEKLEIAIQTLNHVNLDVEVKVNGEPVDPAIQHNNEAKLTKAINGIKTGFKTAVKGTPSALWKLAGFIIPSPYTILNMALPAGNCAVWYLFNTRNLDWFMSNQTSFANSVNELNQWAKEDITLMRHLGVEESYQELVAMMNMFVPQVEGILGFMNYACDILPQKYMVERARATIIMNKIKKLISALSLTVDKAAQRAEDSETEIAKVQAAVKLFTQEIKKQCVQFKFIQKNIGLDKAPITSEFGELAKNIGTVINTVGQVMDPHGD